MGEGKNQKIKARVKYYDGGNAKEDRQEIFRFFSRIFSDFTEVKEEEVGRQCRNGASRQHCDLLVMDCRGISDKEKERCIALLDEMKAQDEHLKELILYRQDEPEILMRFLERGIRCFFPVPWSKEAVHYVLKPLIEIMTFPRRLHRCQWELEHCRKRVEKLSPTLSERLSELQNRLETEESFFHLKTEEMEQYLHDIINIRTLLMQRELEENDRELLARVDRAATSLGSVIAELRDYSNRGAECRCARHPFNLNSILSNSVELCRDTLERGNVELVFDVDHSVPARITGNPVLLGQTLVKILRLFAGVNEHGELLLRLYLEKSQRDPQEKRLCFELRTAKGEKDWAGLLGDNPEIRESGHWVEEMGGTLRIGEEADDVFLLFDLPIRPGDRRSYRLPAREWMDKSMLIVEASDLSAKALAGMLAYFHFHVERVATVREAVERLYSRSFDMIFIRDRLFEAFYREGISVRREAKLVVMTRGEAEHRRTGESDKYIDAFLPVPFTQQNIFDVLLQVYSKDHLNGMQETLSILKENLIFLLGGKTAVYLGKEDSDLLTVKSLLEGIKILMLQSSDLKKGERLLPGADLVLIDDRFAVSEWDALDELCKKSCQEQSLFALLHENSSERKEALKKMGVENLLSTPVDPEAFYRLLLESLLEKGVF